MIEILLIEQSLLKHTKTPGGANIDFASTTKSVQIQFPYFPTVFDMGFTLSDSPDVHTENARLGEDVPLGDAGLPTVLEIGFTLSDSPDVHTENARLGGDVLLGDAELPTVLEMGFTLSDSPDVHTENARLGGDVLLGDAGLSSASTGAVSSGELDSCDPLNHAIKRLNMILFPPFLSD